MELQLHHHSRPLLRPVRLLHPCVDCLDRLGRAWGVSVGVGYFLSDLLAHGAHLWWYPLVQGRPFGPIVWYLSGMLSFAGINLLLWRLHRRYGMPALVAVVVGLPAFLLLKVVVVPTVAPEVFALGSGVTPWIALYLTWFALTGLGIAVRFAAHAALARHEQARPSDLHMAEH
jgi:hypothetical protein